MKGRGSNSNIQGRFESLTRDTFDDGWDQSSDDPRKPLNTEVTEERVKSILSTNQSPDIPFRYSINPYRGCEHGCSYCFARPTHSFIDLSPGLDFESKLFAKINAAECLKREISKKRYVCSPISIGASTDPYQPIEKKYEITRSLIRVLSQARHPFNLVTKNALVERDIDLLTPLAERSLVKVYVSITTLNNRLAHRLEPRASAPLRRFETIKRLRDAGIPVGVMFAPVIPFLNDSELESLLSAASDSGASSAGYLLLRLPHEVRPLFFEWLDTHYPMKAKHVKARLRGMRDGQENDTQFERRFKGQGEFAKLLKQRFAVACRRYGFAKRAQELTSHLFDADLLNGQASLF
ncbi:MAG: PA0069 family radical SAM protein [Burkholderiales bacterium]|nr:PA0069 family radical SAM protein [Burkholderiales bacterium]